MVDETKLNQFIGQMLGDLGGALSVSLVRIGDRLGLYKALHDSGPMSASELATKRKSRSGMRASGCRIKPRRDICRTILTAPSSPCRLNRQWYSPSPRARSTCRAASISRQ
jgi:hypothetical protein